VGHLSYGGRVDHDAVVRITHEARVHLFHLLNVAESNLGDDRTGIIMGDLVVNYAGESFLFDRLQVDSHVGEMGRSGFRIFHRFKKGETLIALVETGLMAFDYAARAIAPIPEAFRSALRQYLGSRA
jgi:acyl-CoA thioester hydrolase